MSDFDSRDPEPTPWYLGGPVADAIGDQLIAGSLAVQSWWHDEKEIDRRNRIPGYETPTVERLAEGIQEDLPVEAPLMWSSPGRAEPDYGPASYDFMTWGDKQAMARDGLLDKDMERWWGVENNAHAPKPTRDDE